MSGVRVHPAPVQAGGPPIVVAGRKEAAMRRAALLGDGWMPYLYSPRRYAASVATVRELAAAAGRDLPAFGWYAFVFVNVDDDGDRARQQAAATLGGTYRQDVRGMLDAVAAAGTPREVTAVLRAFVDAGARHLVLVPVPGTGDAGRVVLRLLAEILPEVRARTSGKSDQPAATSATAPGSGGGRAGRGAGPPP
jgi:alkanesulfonate monooxygenase SsuD/methylene tetrahydromethanopterin reductase-like flavin-dependent oxidoreductase (luciferase family)